MWTYEVIKVTANKEKKKKRKEGRIELAKN